MPVRKELEIRDLRPMMKSVIVEGRLMKLSGVQKTKKGPLCTAFLKQGKFRARLRLEKDMIGKVERGDMIKLLNFDTQEGKLTLVSNEKSIIVANGRRVWVGRELREMEARRKKRAAPTE
ncbi:MAG: hypothetical protein KAS60_07390 [Thermoplasmata archaeon]|nr:hypothetical protein [Candidatus Thermoplasmatota archaeon]MCK4949893.1 hypothetical protein [Thermoplasmata archaeon]